MRVLDLSRLVAGNILTPVLADLGAEVIKVEKPGRGDNLRNWKNDGMALWWQVYGRNKKSLCLDLRQDAGREVAAAPGRARRGPGRNYRPGTLETLGLGPRGAARRNPRLVIVRVSGWGQTGPWRHKPGFGTLIEAFSGFAAMNGFADRAPVLPAFAMADAFAGLAVLWRRLTALRAAEAADGPPGDRSGADRADPRDARPQGRGVSADRHATPRPGSRCMIQAPRDVYRTKDGKYVALSTGTQAMAERLFGALGRARAQRRSALSHQRRALANRERVEAWSARSSPGAARPRRSPSSRRPRSRSGRCATRPISPTIPTSPSARCSSRCRTRGRQPADAQHRPRLSATPGALRRPAPALGEHNVEICARSATRGRDPAPV